MSEFLKNQTFSPAEAAEIMDVPVNTVKTWLQRVPKVFTPEREPGEWRRLTPDTLLAMRIMQKLVNNHGLKIEAAANVIDHAIRLRRLPNNYVEPVRVSMFEDDEALELNVDLGPDGSVIEQSLSGPNQWGDKSVMVNFHNDTPVDSRIIMKLNPSRIELQTRIAEFIGKRGD
jgi:hypothetical protein